MQAAWLIPQGALPTLPAMFSAARIVDPGRLPGHHLLRWAILAVDMLLRRGYGVQEFSGDPSCLLRIAPGVAAAPVCLPDGTDLAAGDPILELHLWNEQLPRYRGERDGLAWAARFRAALDLSLRLLAAKLAADPALAQPRALRAEIAFVTRGRACLLARIAAHYGFSAPRAETIGPDRPRRDLGGDLLIFGLTLACNPLSLRGKTLRRDRHELWISRERLLALYQPHAPVPEQATTAVLDQKAAA